MPDKYYYLVSSLPSLKLEETSPVTREDFLSECRKWLSQTDLGTLAAADINDTRIRPEDPQIIREWKSFDLTMKEDLARIRKARKTLEHEKMPVFFKDVFEEPTPLLMEKNLQQKRWFFLEQKEFGHHFDIEALILYFLKLQIMERLAVFDTEKGRARFESLCEVSDV